jgi:hypothetical protein
METRHEHSKIIGILIALMAFVGISCGGTHVSVMDVSQIKPPNADFAISERAIADETYGEVTFSSLKRTKLHLQVIPNPPVTDDTKSMVLDTLEVYKRTLAERPNACGTFKYRTYEVYWYGLKIKGLSPQGEVVLLLKTNTKSLISTISGGDGPEFSESAVKLAIQLFDANSEAISLK